MTETVNEPHSAFPVRDSAVFALSELVSYSLGLMFLSRFVHQFGLDSGAVFRTVMPLIGAVACLGSIGLPMSIMRYMATIRSQVDSPVPRKALQVVITAVSVAALGTLAFALSLLTLAATHHWVSPTLYTSFLCGLPLLVLLCMNGNLRALLIGLGATVGPGIARCCESLFRLLVLFWVIPIHRLGMYTIGANRGLFVITASETLYGVLLGTMLAAALLRRHVTPVAGPLRGASQSSLRAIRTVFRMALSPTGQALLATLGYALMLPFAAHLLTPQYGRDKAETIIGVYAAVSLPLLCAPMVLLDGMATALLPSVSSHVQSAAHRYQSDSTAVHSVLRIVSLLSIPWAATVWVCGDVMVRWFGAPSATPVLHALAPLPIILFLQSPLGAILQAEGRSRLLILAGFSDIVVTLSLLWIGVEPLRLGMYALALAFYGSAVVQAVILLVGAVRLTRVHLPIRTIVVSGCAAVYVAAELMVGRHTGTLAQTPWFWGVLAVGLCLFTYWLSGEMRWRGWLQTTGSDNRPQQPSHHDNGGRYDRMGDR